MEPDDMRGGGFPATRHSAIERIRDGNPEARREAFGDLTDEQEGAGSRRAGAYARAANS